jgi:hypothetical protein
MIAPWTAAARQRHSRPGVPLASSPSPLSVRVSAPGSRIERPQARITVTCRPAGVAATRSSTGGKSGRRSKITSQPLSRPSPDR